MNGVLLFCVFLSFQILQCLSQDDITEDFKDYFGDGNDKKICFPRSYVCDGDANCKDLSKRIDPTSICKQDPSIGEYFLAAVDVLDRTRWRYFLPEDTDIDQDGNLSDLEVQHKFNTYMGEVFKLIDDDKDNSIVEEEFRSLKLDIPHLTKAVDIALENFPLRPFFLAADLNGDGVYDEDDFYIPKQNRTEVTYSHSNQETILDIEPQSNKVTMGSDEGVAKIGENEGTVICKSLGFDSLETIAELMNGYADIAFSCEGTEERLEDCQKMDVSHQKRNQRRNMAVTCRGPLRLFGGKDSASGDIFFGRKGLTCNPSGYWRNNSEVICRELGYSGVIRMTDYSSFTGYHLDQKSRINKEFACNGNEQRLEDCPVLDGGKYCDTYHGYMFGVVCATDGRPGIDGGLDDLLRWNRNEEIWEVFGRLLFIADANADGKLTLEEVATKAKKFMTKILEFLDENQDGKISLEDINLHLSVGPIQNLASELFHDITKGEAEIDLYNMKIAGLTVYGPKELDKNGDEKLNVADIFQHLDSRVRATFLIPMLSQKLDKNQDGKIHRDELREFIDEMFKQVDMDKNGAITLEDAYSLLRENGLDCLQVGVLRSFIKVFLDTLDTETRNFFGYIFHQFDINGDGQISPTELEQMHVPCDMRGRYRNRDYDNNSNDDSDPNDKKDCEDMFITYFGWMTDLFRSYPDFLFLERGGRGGYRVKRWGGDGHGSRGGSRYEPRRDTIVDKLTDHVCEMLT